jgi:hypothetical protein
MQATALLFKNNIKLEFSHVTIITVENYTLEKKGNWEMTIVSQTQKALVL